MKNRQVITCNECNTKFFSDNVEFKEAELVRENQLVGESKLSIIYFTCPVCKHIYMVCVKDKDYQALHDDVEKIKIRIRRNAGKKQPEKAETLNVMLNRKLQRLKRYLDKKKEPFKTGTFTFAASENKCKEGNNYIIYHE